MTIELRVIPEHNLAHLVHSGRTPDYEFLAFYRNLYGGKTVDRSMNLLVDLRRADSQPRSPEVLRQLAVHLRGIPTGSDTRQKVAAVAPSDLSFGLARMYDTYADSNPSDFEVFRTLDAALAWLGLPEELMTRLDAEPREGSDGIAENHAP